MNTNLTPQQIQVLAAMGMAPVAIGQQPAQQGVPAATIPLGVVQGQQPNQQAQAPSFSAQFTNQQLPPQGQQAQQPAQILSQRIPAGPGIPAALVGRPVQELVDALVRQANTIQQQNQQRANTPQAQAQQILNAGQPQVQTQTPAGLTLEAVQEIVRGAVQENSLPSLIMQVEQSVQQQIPQYSNPVVRQKVQEIMGQQPPELQANRNAWDYAVKVVLGEMAMQGQQIPGGFIPGQQQQNAPYVTGARPNGNVPFTEQPTGAPQYGVQGRPAITQMEAEIATKFGLNPVKVAEYNQQVFSGGNY